MASGEMTAEDLAAFKAWRAAAPAHNTAFERERDLWRGLPSVAANQSHAPGPGRRRLTAIGAGALAACLALFIFGPRAAIWIEADYQTGSAIRNVTLPDGTTAVLDAGSAIAIHYTADERRIELLHGDAWFDVKHDGSRPFRIAALGGITEDVGTAFEVRRDTARVSIGVTQGLVRVATPGDGVPGVEVHEGERVSYVLDGPVTFDRPVGAEEIAAWRRGELVIDGATVADAVARIGHYRNAPAFVIGDVSGTRPISAVFRTDRPDEALEAVAATAHLQMLRLPGGVILLRPGAR